MCICVSMEGGTVDLMGVGGGVIRRSKRVSGSFCNQQYQVQLHSVVFFSYVHFSRKRSFPLPARASVTVVSRILLHSRGSRTHASFRSPVLPVVYVKLSSLSSCCSIECVSHRFCVSRIKVRPQVSVARTANELVVRG